jgi:malonate-semialdehyde dehydrogenase (acetylating)/methylmalonate-semialdehyde dehydrogenase
LASAAQKEFVEKWIAKGIEQGAEVVLDGRRCQPKGFENGYFVGPTILDKVKPGMTVGDEEIFGPVLCVKRCRNFEDGLSIMNANPFANGSSVFTTNGHYAREFSLRTDGGMVGINVGIPVPLGFFPFSGHKRPFYGDLHCLGRDGMKFYTKVKTVTTKWISPAESQEAKVSTWEGTINRQL